MIVRNAHFIDGGWVPATAAGTVEVLEPATERPLGTVTLGSAADVDQAVRAARSAQAAWAGQPVDVRAEYLRRVAEALESREDEVIDLLIREVGTPRRLAGVMQFRSAVNAFREAADLAESLDTEETIANSVIRRVPAGVVGLITPWNYPLYQAALKVAPALAVGCTAVLKPSELASLSTMLLADVAAEIGLPAGVLNLVLGDGPLVGETLAGHPDVDLVSFTGSVRGGRRVAEVAARHVTPVALELGGKGASVVLPGADLAAAAAHATASCFGNAGQTCAAMTRMIVPAGLADELTAAIADAAAQYVPGDPLDPQTWLGPVISDRQRSRVREYLDAGVAAGAELLTGGPDPSLTPEHGYYVPATVFTGVTPDMRIAREEIFGPVLSIMAVEDSDDAVRVANDTDYGLTATVWASDDATAREVAGRLDVGSVTVNGGAFNPSAPFGGRKGSGYGRERGKYGLEEFTAVKAYHL